MKKFILITSCILSLSFPSVFAAGCAIENGPHPSLIEYRKNVDIVLSRLLTTASRASACGRNGGAENQTRRSMDRIDASINSNFSQLDIWNDFQFNLGLIGIAETRGPTKRDAEFLRAIGDKILNGVNTAGIYCAMDIIAPTQYDGIIGVTSPNGKTIEEVFDLLIVNHKGVESYYKSVSVDENPGDVTLSEVERKLEFILVPTNFLIDIKSNYNTTALESCKPPSGSVDWDRISAKFMSLITFQGAGTERGFKAWRDAIDLLDGSTAKKRSDQIANEKRILSAELSRQGVTGKARDTVLRNLEAYNNAGNANDPELEMRVNRFGNNITTSFSEGISKALTSAIFTSTNTDIWVRRVNNVKIQKKKFSPMADEYNKAKALLGEEAATDMKVISDLVDLHMKLSQANKNLKIAIPKIQQLCEKQLTGVGNCRNYGD